MNCANKKDKNWVRTLKYIDMLLIVENGIISRICHAVFWYTIADKISFIYIRTNCAQVWIDKIQYGENSDIGYF